MKLIESKAEYIPQEEGLNGIYKQIELAGRTAYHSQDKITPTSAKDFVDRMIKSKHGAALEHGTVYLYCKSIGIEKNAWFSDNPYSKVVSVLSDTEKGMNGQPVYHQYITTNYRVIEELKCPRQLQLICSPTKFHEKRYTMRFTCSRAIAQELARHRTFSFLMESQRYINYSKERHGGEITYIIPSWLKVTKEEANDFIPLFMAGAELNESGKNTYSFYASLLYAETNYFALLNNGFTPQQARDVLPNATKTELIMTGFSSDWRFLMDLRLFEKTGKVHPDMLDLMQKAQTSMQEAGIWEDIMNKPSKFE